MKDGTYHLSINWARYNGDLYNESAGGKTCSDPHIWINESHHVDVKLGYYYGQADGYNSGSDGELTAYDSTNVNFIATHV